MGQPITVIARKGVRPDVMHFEINRSLTGMQTLRYRSAEDAQGPKPPDELARRLFPLGVTSLTVYSSVITVVAPASRWPELQGRVEETIANLFLYYRDAVAAAPPRALESGEATSGEPNVGEPNVGEPQAGEPAAVPAS